jgi:hypothetical protein
MGRGQAVRFDVAIVESVSADCGQVVLIDTISNDPLCLLHQHTHRRWRYDQKLMSLAFEMRVLAQRSPATDPRLSFLATAFPILSVGAAGMVHLIPVS